ncbi:endolytic transglycosylase MltG [Candidatus Kaiserbacteria bacterium]|nr:endolytic transglycosylase MltG [Candidatus Kaiserbacteria bacterium]
MDFLHAFLKKLRQFFDDLDRVQLHLSQRWVEHTNRRTIIIILVAGILAVCTYLFLIRPPDDFPLNHLVEVPEGQTLTQISRKLHEQGVVRSALAFRVAATLSGKGRRMQADDYLFKEPHDLFSVIRIIALGENGLVPIRIRIPEGANTRQMAVIFGSQLERFDQANFLTQATPLEGYLFPDTYNFLPNANEGTVIKSMRDRFDEILHATTTPPLSAPSEKSLAEQIEASGHTLEEIVNMASIIEKEAFNSNDRRMISGVLWNRIRKDMALQVDVTFLYTMGKSTFSLTRDDLKSDSAYNTYVHKGLPPTPIGSPSLDSLQAAVNPTKNDYLFYLADDHGTTYFSKTYQQHLTKKSIYIDN